MALPAIELRSVSHSFGEEKILDQVSLTIAEGENLSLIGPSGQGKSLVLKLIAGLVVPDEGDVLISNLSWKSMDKNQKNNALLKMGMLFQKNALFDSMTVAENVAFPLREVTQLSTKEIDEKVDFFLNSVGILHAKLLYPAEISGGMQKRLGIARALALNPKIILYDDPTAGLDPITSRKIVDLIVDLQKRNNSTVVAITNDMNRAYQMANTIAMVVDKKIIKAGTPEETKSSPDPRIQQFIHGRVEGPLHD